jgi:hypothetical protein
MPRSAAATVEKNFVNGFVTEATALNFPEAAATDTENCVFNIDGSFNRRLGIDYESLYDTLSVNRDGQAMATFLWTAANGNGNNNLVVLQIGLTLYFYVIGDSSLSAGLHGDTVDLSAYIVDPLAPNPEQIECQFAYGKGYLFVTHPYMDPVFVSYDGTNITSEAITVKVRDTDGIDDTLEVNERPSSLSDEHKYNLYNQGWAPYETGGINDPRPAGLSAGSLGNLPTSYLAGDPLSTWDSNRTDYPSNADIWWLYKDSWEVFQPKIASTLTRGNSPAPKGRYILEAFNMDRSAAVAATVNTGAGSVSVAIAGLDVVSSGYFRPRCVAFFAGRVWYAGVDAEGYSNKLYFSQIITEGSKKFGDCYAQNDPTSEQSFDALATDGGTVQILDCGTILKVINLNSSLVIFATNGIWTIAGSTGIGFTPTDMSVNKISSVPNLTGSSFVDVAGMPAWWTTDGVYIVTQSNQVGSVTVTSLTEKKIKRFYTDEIPAECKKYARGYFNPLTKVIHWVYRSTVPESITERYEYDKVLCFNTITQAFYKWTISDSPVKVHGVISIRGIAGDIDLEVVTSGGNDVTVDGSELVYVYAGGEEEIAGVFKYVVSRSNGATSAVTFAEEYDDQYVDFFTEDDTGVDYESFVTSGYRIRGEAQKKFQSNYVFVFLDTNSDNVCHFGGIWDYATLDSTGDYGTNQLIDTSGTSGRRYRFKKLKVRGSGLSLQFKITSISGEPFKIVGWSTFDTGNTVV